MTRACAKAARRPRRAAASAGLTLVECTLAIALVAGLFVGVAQLVAAVGAVRAAEADRSTGRLLAEALAAELAGLPVGSGAPGAVANEGPDRRTLRTVIQHHGLVESPIIQRDGSVVPGYPGWSRHVRIAWVDPANPSNESPSDTGAAAVTIEVHRAGRPVNTVTVYRSRAWDSTRAPEQGAAP